MKKLTLLFITIFTLLNICNAHEVKPECWSNGRYKLSVINGPFGGTAHITTNLGFDTVINITSNLMLISVPQPTLTSFVHVVVVYSDGLINELNTGINQCTTLNIKKIDVSYRENDFGEYLIWITVDDDVDVSNYKIVNKKTNKVYKILIPTNRIGVKTYYLKLKID